MLIGTIRENLAKLYDLFTTSLLPDLGVIVPHVSE